MSSWKESFDVVNQELELTKKKKQALDHLLSTERISQPTYEYLEKGLAENIIDLEAHQKSLADKMTSRADELEKQTRSLELFLANLEIHNIAREIDQETYTGQKEVITLGLEATKGELNLIKGSLMKIATQPAEAAEAQEAAVTQEVPSEEHTETEIPESVPEPIAEVGMAEGTEDAEDAEDAEKVEKTGEASEETEPYRSFAY